MFIMMMMTTCQVLKQKMHPIRFRLGEVIALDSPCAWLDLMGSTSRVNREERERKRKGRGGERQKVIERGSPLLKSLICHGFIQAVIQFCIIHLNFIFVFA